MVLEFLLQFSRQEIRQIKEVTIKKAIKLFMLKKKIEIIKIKPNFVIK